MQSQPIAYELMPQSIPTLSIEHVTFGKVKLTVSPHMQSLLKVSKMYNKLNLKLSLCFEQSNLM